MEPAPDPAAGEVLVRVAAVGICGSDVHWYNEGAIGDARLGRPLVLGHEASGVIVDGPRAGTRVAIDPAIACERCELCLEGRPNLCAGVRFSGHGMTDGSLRELMAWPERCLVPIPDALDAVEAALLEPLGVALHATDLGRSAFGGSVGVYGCGPIGLLLVQLCQLARVSAVFASDVLPHRVEAARRLGATAFDVSSPQGRSALVAATGSGVDVAFEMSGEDDAVDTALETVRPGRTVVLSAFPRTIGQPSRPQRRAAKAPPSSSHGVWGEPTREPLHSPCRESSTWPG